MVIVYFLMIVQVILPPIPAELIVVAAGKIHGVGITTLVAGSGLFTGGVAVYFLGRFIERGFHGIFARQKVARVIDRLHEVETLLLLVRVLPYNPSDIISYAAGIIKVKLRKYLLITFAVSFVRCFLLAYFGSMITDMQTLFVIFGLLFLSAMLGWAVVFGMKGKRKVTK